MAGKNLFLRGVRFLRERPPSGSYIFSLPLMNALREWEKLPIKSPVTFFVGENGTGKSTLMEAIAVCAGFNAEGGGRNFTFSTRTTHSDLCDYLRLVRGTAILRDGYFLRAESFYNVASNIDDLDGGSLDILEAYGGRSLHTRSHGESFVALVEHRFGGEGLYLLDEPEAALSPMRQMALLSLIADLVRRGSQFLISTHSPILMAYPGAEIYMLNEAGLALTPYEETEHYRVTRDFLNRPGQMLKHLLQP